jgi:hypothetical protein
MQQKVTLSAKSQTVREHPGAHPVCYNCATQGLFCPSRAVASCAAYPLVFMRFLGRLALRAVTL